MNAQIVLKLANNNEGLVKYADVGAVSKFNLHNIQKIALSIHRILNQLTRTNEIPLPILADLLPTCMPDLCWIIGSGFK